MRLHTIWADPTGMFISGDRMGISSTESDKNKGNIWSPLHPLIKLPTPFLVFNKTIAELVLVQHQAFQRWLSLQAFPRRPKHNKDWVFMHSALKHWKRGSFLYFAGTKMLQRLLWPWLQTMSRRFLQTLLWKWAGKQSIQQHPALQTGEGWTASQKSLEYFCTTRMLGSTRAAPFICVQWWLWISGSVIAKRENEPLKCPNCRFLGLQHTGKAEWPILMLIICTAQSNDPATYSHIRTAKKGKIYSSKEKA